MKVFHTVSALRDDLNKDRLQGPAHWFCAHHGQPPRWAFSPH